ncbi:MAG: transglycosylase domain-containing protein [Pseudomonadota bacterium]
MIEFILREVRLKGGTEPRVRRRRARLHTPARLRQTLAGVAAAVGLCGLAFVEMKTSALQSLLFAWRAQQLSFAVAPGPSSRIAFPRGGPHDERLGYRRLPEFIARLRAQGYRIDSQARISQALHRYIADHGYAVYREKPAAGLRVVGHDGTPLFARQFPNRAFTEFDAVPPLVADTLLFIEDRSLLDGGSAWRNPAVDWPRFAVAVAGQLGGVFDPGLRQGGASTLATQIEKIRHSPDGRTRSAAEKLRQMAAASLRSYLDGSNTLQARRRIVATYLDSLPLAARADYGEVIGLGNGLWAWYGADLADVTHSLTADADSGGAGSRAARARAYKQVLSLLLATRRPAWYLQRDPESLAALTERYLHALAAAGVIDPALRDAALREPLRFVERVPAAAEDRQPAYKAAYRLRTQLLQMLQLDDLAALDRIDVAIESTLDTRAQLQVARALRRLGERDYARTRGLLGPYLLGENGLDRVIYGLVLYEGGGDRNRLRIRADSYDGPFDVNSGAKLVMGSSAKLRTLVTYLNVVAGLHERLAPLQRGALEALSRSSDTLTVWGARHLLLARDRGLQPMLDAAMQRRYSASPYQVFFTGGGEHVFHNYKRDENDDRPTVEEAFSQSVNLVFVRLLRDLVDHFIARAGVDVEALLGDRAHPARAAYLMRFADREGMQFLGEFYERHRAAPPDAMLARLAARVKRARVPLAIVFRSLRPQAPVSALAAFLDARLGASAPGDAAVEALYAEYAPERFSWSDRGYLTGLHPLELWLAAYLQAHPQASYRDVMLASADERQAVYRWLFRTRYVERQNTRIRMLLEQDAFRLIHEDWVRQGYPFDHLVPSLATAIGSSGDRPDALADLVGIILNDGMRRPDSAIDALHFAAGTPYETRLEWVPPPGQRVLLPEVARTARRALEAVVERGTARRLRGAYRTADCRVLHVGGKTGTSDERFKIFGAGGRLIDERPVNRTATFVFFLGERFFGTVTAYVPGPASADFHFTSAMAVQLLRALAPELSQVVGSAPADAMRSCATVADLASATG